MFDYIVGNERIKGFLSRMVAKGEVGNSLLFAGPQGIGKTLFALAFAKMLLSQDNPTEKHLHKLETGSHPDIHIYSPEGKSGMHSIGAMRSLSEEVYLPPHEATRKVFIIRDADRMLTYSANALLKTFEEPSLDTVIILLSSSPDLLLPTILSRCSTFQFHPLSDEEMVALLTTRHKQSPEKAKQITALSQGSVSKALRLCEGTQDPLRNVVMQMLAEGKFSSYSQLIAKAKEIGELVEASTKRVEESSKQELLKGYCDKLSATQRENVDKELEGIASIQSMHEVDAVFNSLLTWHRDLHLLETGADERYLFNPDFLEELRKQVARAKGTELFPLDDLQEAIKITKLGLARSIGLTLCLENLFLRLNMLP
ncbi:MAG: AAA family ATPase [Parachlamydiaceae bacterium]|nr:AAA family ATPase [Parachlamydiaceae bacterium]